jgi:quercetin dioxygenase-like cupin family protein
MNQIFVLASIDQQMCCTNEEDVMGPVKLNELVLLEGWCDEDATVRARFEVPTHVGTGAASSSTVYMEVEPGCRIGRHVDSAEELLLVLEGEAEVVLGNERQRLDAGAVALAPAMVPHDCRNVGSRPLRLLGFFSSSAVLTRHDDVIQPLGSTTFTLGDLPAAEAADEPPRRGR